MIHHIKVYDISRGGSRNDKSYHFEQIIRSLEDTYFRLDPERQPCTQTKTS